MYMSLNIKIIIITIAQSIAIFTQIRMQVTGIRSRHRGIKLIRHDEKAIFLKRKEGQNYYIITLIQICIQLSELSVIVSIV